MPRLKPSTQVARQERILDAAEACFARAGFHRTTMQDIASGAGVSLGALYVYFKSKEALIAGIAERDRSKLQREFAGLADAPDLVAAIGKLGEHYTVEEPQYKRVLCLEIGVEATRNEAVGQIFRSVDRFVLDGFTQLFERARADGRIDPALDTRTIAMVLAVLGDGLFWRRAIDPDFDAKSVMPAILAILGGMLNPTGAAAQPLSERTSETHA
ncbi:MAG: TetR/AcrR family transcriptional regulator [Hyphomicrobiaceae bacterium]